MYELNGKPRLFSLHVRGKLNGKVTQLMKAGAILRVYAPVGVGPGAFSKKEQSLLDNDLENEFL